MPIPRWFVNGNRVMNPESGQIICELNPPFDRHETVEILVHCTLAVCELRHTRAGPEIRQLLLVGNQDTVYVTVDPGDRLVLYYVAVVQQQIVQGSLYVF